jgi:hypothetical protein
VGAFLVGVFAARDLRRDNRWAADVGDPEAAGLRHDGSLGARRRGDVVGRAFAETLEYPVWGQGFKAPTFGDTFNIAEQRLVGGKHLKLRLKAADSTRVFDGILFGQENLLPNRIFGVYGVQVNEFNSVRSVQLVLEHWQGVSGET